MATVIKEIKLDQLSLHPDNPRLVLQESVIDGIAAQLQESSAFDPAHALLVRLMDGGYQIVHGHHRYEAAKKAGLDTVPCWVREMDDTEAYMQLALGNVQGELDPIEIGMHALQAIGKGDKWKGGHLKAYAESLGKSGAYITQIRQAAKVLDFIKLTQVNLMVFLGKAKHLSHVHKCTQDDWLWLSELVLAKSLSAVKTAEVTSAIRQIIDIIEHEAIFELFDVPKLKETIADQLIEDKSKGSRALKNNKPLIVKVQKALAGLETSITFYEYDVSSDKITDREVNLQQALIARLCKQKLTATYVNQCLKSVLKDKRQHTKKAAEADAKYLRAEKHKTELADLRRIDREEQQSVQALWWRCETEEAIAKELGLSLEKVEGWIRALKTDTYRHVEQAQYEEEGYAPPIFNVWKLQMATNKVVHPGQSEARWADNLLYQYTEPPDIVVDPFAGGGGTIGVCQKRLRRYWVSDRKPIDQRIRKYDIEEGPPPLQSEQWEQVALLFLDPPYWKQVEEAYSKDSEDLANMELDEFYDALTGFITACTNKMRVGAHIAMLMQPTQWRAPDRRTIDHVFDIRSKLLGSKLRFVQTIQCPYESQQANAQQVEWAKEERKLLEIGRTITVWEVIA